MLRTLPWVALALSCTPPSPPPEPVERPAAAAQALSYELGLELGRKMQARGTEPDLPSVTRGVKEGYQAASSVSQARAPAPMKEPEALRRLCTGCHALARPTDLTRAWWSEVLTRMNAWMTRQGLGATPAELEAITRWYEAGAPRAWQLPADPPPSQLRFEPTPLRGLTEVAAITLADLNGDGRPELLTGDLASGSIQRWDLRDGTWSATWLGLAGAPVRITAADVDGDGDQDLVVADIGAFRPAEQDTGRVLLLRAERGEYRAEVLWAGAPRPCDVRVADVDGDGDPDVIVAAFGWFTAGEIVWLEQHPSGWRRHRVIQRTGAVDVTPTDLDGDGGLDLVALFAQEHEEIVALRQHTGGFRPQRLHAAGTPLYGSSGLQVVDLDGDGQRDLLYVNGDSQDGPPGPRPDHGVRWLKRQGGAYEVRDIGRIGEAFRAAPGDLDGDGDLDVVLIRNRRELREPGAALLWFEQREEGWRGHSIGAPHAALRAVAVGDLDADGRVEIDGRPQRGGGVAKRPMSLGRRSSREQIAAVPALSRGRGPPVRLRRGARGGSCRRPHAVSVGSPSAARHTARSLRKRSPSTSARPQHVCFSEDSHGGAWVELPSLRAGPGPGALRERSRATDRGRGRGA